MKTLNLFVQASTSPLSLLNRKNLPSASVFLRTTWLAHREPRKQSSPDGHDLQNTSAFVPSHQSKLPDSCLYRVEFQTEDMLKDGWMEDECLPLIYSVLIISSDLMVELNLRILTFLA